MQTTDTPGPRTLTPNQVEAAIESMRWLAAWVDDNAVTQEHQDLADAWTELDQHFCNGGALPHEWEEPAPRREICGFMLGGGPCGGSPGHDPAHNAR